MRLSLLRRLKRNITFFANSVIFIGAITALLYIFPTYFLLPIMHLWLIMSVGSSAGQKVM